MAYSISTAFAIYFVLWWLVLFLTLPFGVRSQLSTRVKASSACARCRASQFPARLKRGSRNAVGMPCTSANASRGFAKTNAA